eukprot:5950453-Heterocapsa_arctica.AAC.1
MNNWLQDVRGAIEAHHASENRPPSANHCPEAATWERPTASAEPGRPDPPHPAPPRRERQRLQKQRNPQPLHLLQD